MAIPALPAHGASWDGWAAGIDAAARTAVPKWQPSTAYTAGDIVINPSGQTVTANSSFTSGATYSASNWTIVAGGTGTDATTTTKGVVQLAGDLAGTAAAPTVPGLASKLSITDAAATYVAKANATTLSDTEDAVAGMFTGGTQTGIAFTYNSTTKKVNSTVSSAWNVRTVTTATSAAASDYILANTSGGTFAVAAPAPVAGGSWGIKWTVGTVAPTLTGTFNSAPVLTVLDQAMEFISDGTSWYRRVRPALAQLPDYPAVTDARYDAVGAAATAQGNSLQKSANLSDVASAATARTNLGLGTAATSAATAFDASGAASAAQAYAIQRANHTGTQAISTLSTTGTASSTTYLRGDGAWASPPAGGGGSVPTVRDVLPGSPTGLFAETFPRWMTGVSGASLTSGVPKGAAITLYGGEVVSKLSFFNGGTAMAGPTHQWAALCDSSGTVLAVSADDTSGAWAASATKTFTMGSPYTVASTGAFYLFVCVVATTMPGVQSITQSGNMATGVTPMVSVTAPSGATAPPTVSSSIGTLGGSNTMAYVAVS